MPSGTWLNDSMTSSDLWLRVCSLHHLFFSVEWFYWVVKYWSDLDNLFILPPCLYLLSPEAFILTSWGRLGCVCVCVCH